MDNTYSVLKKERKKERKKTNVLAERLISLLYWEWRGVTYAR